MAEPFIVGITGGSGSGKSQMLRWLGRLIPPSQMSVLSLDNYYNPPDMHPRDEKGYINFDTPEGINHNGFLNDLESICKGNTLQIKEYTFNNSNKTPEKITISPAPVLVLEGLFLFYFKPLFDRLNLKIFLDARDAVRLKRRIYRDKVERGYDIDDVLYRYAYHATPNYDSNVDPLKYYADIIIPNNSEHDSDSMPEGVKILANYIRQKIHDE